MVDNLDHINEITRGRTTLKIESRCLIHTFENESIFFFNLLKLPYES